jgi:hypothetical protein
MFTDKTFYTGDIFIPNLGESCNGLPFFEWIEQWEEQCLRMVLGDCLYNELLEQLEWSDTLNKYVLKEDVEEKWGWLINGKTYTKEDISDQSLNFSPFNYSNCGCGCVDLCCDKYHWDGIVKVLDRRIPATQVNGETANGVIIKSSFLAQYVYWKWAMDSDSFTSGTGEQVAEVKGGLRISNAHKRVNAYNKFVSNVIDCNSHGKVGLYRFVQDFKDLYPEWTGTQLCYESIW